MARLEAPLARQPRQPLAMAIQDLFWACPLCGQVAGIRRRRRRQQCTACGAEFRRGAGAAIVARLGSIETTRTAGEWLRLLGEPPVPEAGPNGVLAGPEGVIARLAAEQRPLRFAGELLGWIEVFGPKTEGTLTLTTDRLVFTADAAAGFQWELRRLTAVQPASSALQVAAGTTVASLRFPQSSVRLWTRALTAALRCVHEGEGREILEFQPRLRTRLLSTGPTT